MKNLLIVLVACLSLVGCLTNTDSTTPESDDPATNNGEYGAYHHINDSQTGCSKTSYMHAEIDGHSFWIEVPTLCDPRPYIFKGDPGPDMGDPYEEDDGPVTKERILETLNDRYVAPSRANSAPYQR